MADTFHIPCQILFDDPVHKVIQSANNPTYDSCAQLDAYPLLSWNGGGIKRFANVLRCDALLPSHGVEIHRGTELSHQNDLLPRSVVDYDEDGAVGEHAVPYFIAAILFVLEPEGPHIG